MARALMPRSLGLPAESFRGDGSANTFLAGATLDFAFGPHTRHRRTSAGAPSCSNTRPAANHPLRPFPTPINAAPGDKYRDQNSVIYRKRLHAGVVDACNSRQTHGCRELLATVADPRNAVHSFPRISARMLPVGQPPRTRLTLEPPLVLKSVEERLARRPSCPQEPWCPSLAPRARHQRRGADLR